LAALAGVFAVAAVLAAVEFWSGGTNRHADPTQAAAADGPIPTEAAHVHSRLSPDRTLERRALEPIRTAVMVNDGDTLLDILLRAGAGRDDATAALAALRRVYDPRTLKVGQRVDVELGPHGEALAARPIETVVLAPEPGRRVTTARGAAGFAASANSLPQVREFAHFAGSIKTSLFDSAMALGVPPPVLATMIAAYSYDVDFQRDLQPGDGFELMYQRTRDSQGEVVRTGDIVYADLILQGKHLTIYRYVDAQGLVDFYNSKGESVRKALLRTPVDGARITSKFGMRVNPILGFSMMHKGVDFGVPIGTPVMAAGSGVVEKAGENGAYGLYIRLRHDKVHGTAYAHLSALAKGLRTGKKVKQGDVIGYVGESGRATGPHLHYEVLVNDQQVNPMSVKFKSGNVLAGRELQRFKSVVAEQETRLAETPVSTQLALAKKAE
jgi:murein DD-endopeptidase MepM/ murein hydrolase activator NlpD